MLLKLKVLKICSGHLTRNYLIDYITNITHKYFVKNIMTWECLGIVCVIFNCANAEQVWTQGQCFFRF